MTLRVLVNIKIQCAYLKARCSNTGMNELWANMSSRPVVHNRVYEVIWLCIKLPRLKIRTNQLVWSAYAQVRPLIRLAPRPNTESASYCITPLPPFNPRLPDCNSTLQLIILLLLVSISTNVFLTQQIYCALLGHVHHIVRREQWRHERIPAEGIS